MNTFRYNCVLSVKCACIQVAKDLKISDLYLHLHFITSHRCTKRKFLLKFNLNEMFITSTIVRRNKQNFYEESYLYVYESSFKWELPVLTLHFIIFVLFLHIYVALTRSKKLLRFN